MTARYLPRELGVVIECNGCDAKERTANVLLHRNHEWLATKGWGRGSDTGLDFRPATEPTVDSIGRKRPGRPATPGRPRNTSHDLCPACLAVDRAATAARKVTSDARRTKRLDSLKARDAAMKVTP